MFMAKLSRRSDSDRYPSPDLKRLEELMSREETQLVRSDQWVGQAVSFLHAPLSPAVEMDLLWSAWSPKRGRMTILWAAGRTSLYLHFYNRKVIKRNYSLIFR